jgi:hypothetical protein
MPVWMAANWTAKNVNPAGFPIGIYTNSYPVVERVNVPAPVVERVNVPAVAP